MNDYKNLGKSSHHALAQVESVSENYYKGLQRQKNELQAKLNASICETDALRKQKSNLENKLGIAKGELLALDIKDMEEYKFQLDETIKNEKDETEVIRQQLIDEITETQRFNNEFAENMLKIFMEYKSEQAVENGRKTKMVQIDEFEMLDKDVNECIMAMKAKLTKPVDKGIDVDLAAIILSEVERLLIQIDNKTLNLEQELRLLRGG